MIKLYGLDLSEEKNVGFERETIWKNGTDEVTH